MWPIAFLKICCNKENLNAIYKLTLFDGCKFYRRPREKKIKKYVNMPSFGPHWSFLVPLYSLRCHVKCFFLSQTQKATKDNKAFVE